VLPDGAHHTLIRNVDIGHDRITVDVVQLFLNFHTLTVRDARSTPSRSARSSRPAETGDPAWSPAA